MKNRSSSHSRTTRARQLLIVTIGAFAALSLGVSPAAARTPLAEVAAVRDALRVLDVWIREQVAAREMPGLSVGVVHDQELVWSAGYGFQDVERQIPATPETPYRMGSVTKLFTATAVLHLRDAGKLELNDPVAKHLPWLDVQSPFPGKPPIRIEHLLTHTSGLPREAPIPYWTTHEFPAFAEVREVLPTLELHSPPGEKYRYSNLGVGLLGQVVEAVSGKPWGEYVADEILRPLGMESSTAIPGEEILSERAVSYMRRMPDDTRSTFDYYDMEGLAPAGNLISTVPDMARFASLQFREGPAGGEQILDGYTLREMRRPHFVYDSWGGGRGLGWGISRDEDTTFVTHGGWIGGNRSHLLLVPAEKIAVIAMTNADDASPFFFSREIHGTLGPVLVKAAAPEEDEEARPVDPSWARFEGTFTDPWAWEYEVLLLSDGLAMYEHDYPPSDSPRGSLARLTHVEGNRFRLPDGDPVIFELGEDGEVERIQRRFEYIYPKEEDE